MKKKSTKKDSVIVNSDKLNELMGGKSLRDYEDSLGPAAGVTYKTLQRMKRGDTINEIYAQAIADHHGIPLEQLLLENNQNPDFAILAKVSAVNNLFDKSNFRFFRRRQESKSISINTRYIYKCPIDEKTSASIKGFLDSIMGQKTHVMYSRNKSLEEEFSYLDAIANANKFIKQLAEEKIYIFYGSYLSRIIGSVDVLVSNKFLNEKYGEPIGDENKNGRLPCLAPMTLYNEIFVFKKDVYEYDKVKIFPNTGYGSFEELKKDYLKILKIDLQGHEKNQDDINLILNQTSSWLDYQENEKNWDLQFRHTDDGMDFNMHKELPFTHLVKHDEATLKKFKHSYRDVGLDILRGAKVLLSKDQKESHKTKLIEKEKEDDHVDTSS